MAFDREVDRIYLGTSDALLLREGPRTLRLRKTNLPDAVIWNPWVEKAKALADFGAQRSQKWSRCSLPFPHLTSRCALVFHRSVICPSLSAPLLYECKGTRSISRWCASSLRRSARRCISGRARRGRGRRSYRFRWMLRLENIAGSGPAMGRRRGSGEEGGATRQRSGGHMVACRLPALSFVLAALPPRGAAGR